MNPKYADERWRLWKKVSNSHLNKIKQGEKDKTAKGKKKVSENCTFYDIFPGKINFIKENVP